MFLRKKLSDSILQLIRQRANYLCEYCHSSEIWQYVRFSVDHIIPLSLGGSNEIDNLCLACLCCNRIKSNKLFAFDPKSGDQSPIFHPRQDRWNEHFIWSSNKIYIIGLTPIGRVTIEVLKLNQARVLYIRAADIAVNRHPPISDPVQTKEKQWN